jgi:hypothetical protein
MSNDEMRQAQELEMPVTVVPNVKNGQVMSVKDFSSNKRPSDRRKSLTEWSDLVVPNVMVLIKKRTKLKK